MKAAEKKIAYIVDDDPDMRGTLEILLAAEGFEACAYASAVEFLAHYSPDMRGCVVTDVSMPGMTGIELIARLKELGSSLPIIVITGHADLEMAVKAMKLGAADFLQKPFSSLALLGAIANAGDAARAAADDPPDLVVFRRDLARLTSREREVLLRMVRGLPNKLIAHDLGLSVRTVDSHRAAVRKKMGGGSFAELVRRSMAIGLGQDMVEKPADGEL